MSVVEDADTEETITCLQIHIYHPQQETKQVFRAINFYRKEKHKTDDVLKFGRDPKFCQVTLCDSRASRIQFALQAFRPFSCATLSFEIKNLSRKAKLFVENMELDYLHKVELPSRCLIRFGDFQLLMQTEEGESLEYFETCFELARVSLLKETLILPSLCPIPECGTLSFNSCVTSLQTPVEVDENDSSQKTNICFESEQWTV
ncbi:TRAF-interacting protein with FHA domain-containing protein A [Latimeria chalumnae]|uniref:TRAF-interacting protein with FHA domain-containing protein A n=1 Tax=Latimeria chalumnae TaxID=7897 RepID=H3AEE3_LATCH|nr:PREDICTED: TRAF-interacting protein with FHA domain-containing protein A [Latimeria chalumnae]|eukprot:XP_006011423.1 PREDICTED: TRAF-interacting protein with FHA domain-containing protein A [Latimeria chalumnae]